MPFAAHVLKVFISTPGDTGEEVDAVRASLHDWNDDRSEHSQVVLLPKFWKTNAVPEMDPEGGQSVINKQLLDTADIVIALFDSRLGEATETAVSGTAEEIERATAAGKPVHVWFSDEPISRNADLAELARVKSFKKEIAGLYGTYTSPSDLAFKVRSAIERDVANLGLGVPTTISSRENAKPRARIDRVREQTGIDKGKIKTRTVSTLVVENMSENVTAENVKIDLAELTRWVHGAPDRPIDLLPHAPLRMPVALVGAIPDYVTIRFSWEEEGEPQSLDQTLSVF